jgi:hypothetical protein
MVAEEMAASDETAELCFSDANEKTPTSTFTQMMAEDMAASDETAEFCFPDANEETPALSFTQMVAEEMAASDETAEFYFPDANEKTPTSTSTQMMSENSINEKTPLRTDNIYACNTVLLRWRNDDGISFFEGSALSSVEHTLPWLQSSLFFIWIPSYTVLCFWFLHLAVHFSSSGSARHNF